MRRIIRNAYHSRNKKKLTHKGTRTSTTEDSILYTHRKPQPCEFWQRIWAQVG